MKGLKNRIIKRLDRFDRNYGIMLETMRDDMKIVIETVASTQERMDTLATKDQLAAVADDVTILKHALTETNLELRSHGKRIIRLERKAF